MEGLSLTLPTSLRWHYPDQVIRVLLSLHRRPEPKLLDEYRTFSHNKLLLSSDCHKDTVKKCIACIQILIQLR